MSVQPASGGQYFRISSLGTTVIKSGKTTLHGIWGAGAAVGTVQLHDAATAAGTTDDSLVFNIPHTANEGDNTLGAVKTRFRNGIVAEATGTPDITLIFD